MNSEYEFKIKFSDKAIKEYKDINKKNDVNIKKIKDILESIQINPESGIGHPERLKGYKERLIYSRKVNKKDRIVYEVVNTFDVIIISLIGHYNDK